jgi:hypothetical protein
MNPKDLHQSQIDVYGLFPLGIFRRHIYQEEYAQSGRSYWMNKKQEKDDRKKEAEKILEQRATRAKKSNPSSR